MGTTANIESGGRGGCPPQKIGSPETQFPASTNFGRMVFGVSFYALDYQSVSIRPPGSGPVISHAFPAITLYKLKLYFVCSIPETLMVNIVHIPFGIMLWHRWVDSSK